MKNVSSKSYRLYDKHEEELISNHDSRSDNSEIDMN